MTARPETGRCELVRSDLRDERGDPASRALIVGVALALCAIRSDVSLMMRSMGVRGGSAKPVSPTCETLKLPGTARTGKSRSRRGVPSEEPLEGELRRGMASALSGVAGVVAVDEEDREVWRVEGSPSGEELLRAAARVVDALADGARDRIDSLGG
jgi:hypothetical protein